MITPMTKVQIAAPVADREALLAWLQEQEILHIVSHGEEKATQSTDTSYRLARVQFALEFIKRLKKEAGTVTKKSWRNLFSGKPIATLTELMKTFTRLDVDALVTRMATAADELAQVTAEQLQMQKTIATYAPWAVLRITGEQLLGSNGIAHWLLTVSFTQDNLFLSRIAAIPTAVWQEVNRIAVKKTGTVYYEVVASQADTKAVEQLVSETNTNLVTLKVNAQETISEQVQGLKKQAEVLQAKYHQLLAECQGFVGQEHDLKYAYDGLLHQQEREATNRATTSTSFVFLISGWIPSQRIAATEALLSKEFPASALGIGEPGETEEAPVSFTNSKLITPFEVVTDIFGKPKYSSLDPTPFLSLFFLVSFGLALTDAGYGLTLMVATVAAEKFFRLKKQLLKMMHLLYYAGFVTVILGALTGGWFGLVLEDLPANALTKMFLAMKVIDPLASPIALLMVAFGIGIVQLLSAWGIKAYDLWRHGERTAAVLDGGAWITMVMAILVWVAATRGTVPASIVPIARWIIVANAVILILSQGRAYKNPLLRLGAGFISLYGLIAFLSDVLSYSRLLALGLATGIIGLVVNLITGMVAGMIPVVGIVFAVIIFIVGHVFNLGINAFGAFIHAGRLQFVEFFPKIMEGGGVPYRPLGHVGRYVDHPNEF